MGVLTGVALAVSKGPQIDADRHRSPRSEIGHRRRSLSSADCLSHAARTAEPRPSSDLSFALFAFICGQPACSSQAHCVAYISKKPFIRRLRRLRRFVDSAGVGDRPHGCFELGGKSGKQRSADRRRSHRSNTGHRGHSLSFRAAAALVHLRNLRFLLNNEAIAQLITESRSSGTVAERRRPACTGRLSSVS